MLNRNIQEGMKWIISKLRANQDSNGSWNDPFETGIVTDCYMIILLRSLAIHDEKLISQLTERILSKQEDNGSWKLFHDEPNGNTSSTIEAYYALLYSGFFDKSDERLMKAKKFIIENGGIGKAHMFTKIMLTITGQQDWPDSFPIPIEAILLPSSSPIHFYSLSVYGRANLTPILILMEKKYQLKTTKSPDLSDLFVRHNEDHNDGFLSFRESEEWRSLLSILKNGLKGLMGLPNHITIQAIERAKQYMLNRIEPDGTFYGYFSSTFLMIFALLAKGYSNTHPIIMKAVAGLQSMKTEINGCIHMQYTTATVWNTALINYAIQEAGIPASEPMVMKANEYLLKKQHFKYGDWIIHNPLGIPGGWGFADSNTIHPDVDDTTAALRSISRNVQENPTIRQAWERGILWTLSMQNDDGGWPAFEKNTNSKLMELLPIEKAEFILTDPSSADVTGRTLEFLGMYTNLSQDHHSIKKAIDWLYKHQEKNGSWSGRWGICYIYGTWAAITGLCSVGVLPSHHSITKAVMWLSSIQNADGGWGESCKSDSEKRYVPLQASTLTHTAWAVDALISGSEQPTITIKKGIHYILENLEKEDWTTDYPKGQGMAGGFYIHYHSYRYLFPLLTLAHYQKKFS